jgi:hypothetical protein
VESSHAVASAAKVDLVIAKSDQDPDVLPAADPLVTAVGATSLTASQPGGTYKSETTWNDSYGSSNGGYSKMFRRPAYQNGFVHSGGRGVPDISYSGDVNNGLLIAWSQGLAANVGNGSRYGYVFHDVTRGNNTVSLAGSTNKTVRIAGYPSTRGWDAVTGLGTPNVAHLLHYLR